MIPYIHDFCVELFDTCLSDVHNAITCVITNSIPSDPCQNVHGGRPFLEDPSHHLATIENEDNKADVFQKLIFRWTPETAAAYECEISNIEPEFEVLCNHLHDLCQNVSQHGINELCDKLNNTMIDVAKKGGGLQSSEKKHSAYQTQANIPALVWSWVCYKKKRIL